MSAKSTLLMKESQTTEIGTGEFVIRQRKHREYENKI